MKCSRFGQFSPVPASIPVVGRNPKAQRGATLPGVFRRRRNVFVIGNGLGWLSIVRYYLCCQRPMASNDTLMQIILGQAGTLKRGGDLSTASS